MCLPGRTQDCVVADCCCCRTRRRTSSSDVTTSKSYSQTSTSEVASLASSICAAAAAVAPARISGKRMKTRSVGQSVGGPRSRKTGRRRRHWATDAGPAGRHCRVGTRPMQERLFAHTPTHCRFWLELGRKCGSREKIEEKREWGRDRVHKKGSG